VKKLLEDFRDMVNFCMDYAARRWTTSYARLRKGIYEEWKRRGTTRRTSATRPAR